MNQLLTGRRICVAKTLLLLLSGTLISLPAHAEIGLRVDAKQQGDPIEAYVLATDEGGALSGLAAEDFAVTLDGAPIGPFELTLPPRQDPTQKVSVVIVARHLIGQPAFHAQAYEVLLRRLAPGDFAAVVLLGFGVDEGRRIAQISLLPFRVIDGGAHSEQIADFLESGQSSVARVISDISPGELSRRGLNHALAQFERHVARLPSGPRAIVTWSIPAEDFGGFIDRAIHNDVSIFTRHLDGRDVSPAVFEAHKAVADNTGGVVVEVLPDSGSAIRVIASWLKDGYRLTIPAAAADDCELHMLEVTVGVQVTSAPFVRCDATPAPLYFPTRYHVLPDRRVRSDAATITGITSPAPVAVYYGQYSIGCGEAFTSEPGYILPDQQICVRHVHDGMNGRTLTTLYIGGVESRFYSSRGIEP
jgi:hypothetical protein